MRIIGSIFILLVFIMLGCANTGILKTGTYQLGSETAVIKTLTVTKKGDNLYSFDIVVAGSRCTGEFSAEGKLRENKVSLETEDCNIFLSIISKDVLRVTETDCKAHGIGCDFSGDYELNE